MFKESLFSLAARTWLAVTLDESADHEPPTRAIDWAYARLHRPDGSVEDVLDLVSLPVPADAVAADEREQVAAGQRALANSQRDRAEQARFKEAAEQYAAEAQALRQPTRLLPRWLFVLEPGQVLCGYLMHRQPIVLRVLDPVAGRVLNTIDIGRIHAQMVGAGSETEPQVDPGRELERLAERLSSEPLSEEETQALIARIEALANQRSTSHAPPIRPEQIRLLAASTDRLLLVAGLERVLVACDGDAIKVLGRWSCLHGAWPVAARTAQGFVFHRMTGSDERDEVLHARAQDGAELGRWPSPRRRTLSVAVGSRAPGTVVALAALGGQVEVLDVEAARMLALPKRLAVDRYDALDLALSPQGTCLAMAPAHAQGASEVDVVDRVRGLAARVALPAVQIRRLATGRQTRSPGFALDDDGLCLLAGGVLHCVMYNGLDWQPPMPPPPAIRRKKTPAATLAAALQQGPLLDIADQVQAWFRPGVILTPRRTRENRLAVAVSKAGGCPDLPVGSAWPRFRDRPMAFLLQVNLAEVAAVEPATGLPRDGLLSVFLALDEAHPMPSFWSEVNRDRAGCRVLYTRAGVALERCPLPHDLPAPCRDDAERVCGYRLRSGGPMLPELSNDGVQRAALTPVQRLAYGQLVRAVNGDDEAPATWATRLGGYPAQMQGDDLHLQAHTHFEELPPTDSTYARWSDPAFQEAAEQWRALLQLSEGEEGWTWGDGGLMHILVDRQQWPDAAFSPAWAIGVCA